MLGFKRDVTATAALYSNGVFQDRRSFLSLPDTQGVTHVRLEGADRTRNRFALIEKAKGKCAVCRQWIGLTGELHHPGRCDCISRKCPVRVEWRCSQDSGRPCHKHFSPGFRRVASEQREAEA